MTFDLQHFTPFHCQNATCLSMQRFALLALFLGMLCIDGFDDQIIGAVASGQMALDSFMHLFTRHVNV